MQFYSNVTLLGGGKAKTRVITEALTFAPCLVAADGGAKNAVKIGQKPEYVIGDFDSIDPVTLGGIPEDRQVRVSEQETTDFEKCLSVIDAPLILGVGFLGGRVDHQLAALNALVRYRDRPTILISKRDLCFHLSGELTLSLKIGTRLSLFPMAPVGGSSAGLKWPIKGLDFAPDGRIGTSNVTIAETVQLSMDGAGMLAIMPQAALAQVVRALAP